MGWGDASLGGLHGDRGGSGGGGGVRAWVACGGAGAGGGARGRWAGVEQGGHGRHEQACYVQGSQCAHEWPAAWEGTSPAAPRPAPPPASPACGSPASCMGQVEESKKKNSERGWTPCILLGTEGRKQGNKNAVTFCTVREGGSPPALERDAARVDMPPAPRHLPPPPHKNAHPPADTLPTHPPPLVGLQRPGVADDKAISLSALQQGGHKGAKLGWGDVEGRRRRGVYWVGGDGEVGRVSHPGSTHHPSVGPSILLVHAPCVPSYKTRLDQSVSMPFHP